MEIGLNATFLKLKPLCDSFVMKPTQDTLKGIVEVLATSPKNVVERLSPYIMFPLTLHIGKKEISNSVQYEILVALKSALDVVTIDKLNMFLHINMNILHTIFDPKNNYAVATVDEEFKLIAIQCIESLYKNISYDIVLSLYTKEKAMHISQTIFVCINFMKNEKFRELRLNAISCLMTVVQVHDLADLNDVELQNQIADVTMLFLAGISIGLRDVALGDEKQGHKITKLAIKALTKIIVQHMEDEPIQQEQPVVFEFPSNPPLQAEPLKNPALTLEDMQQKIQNSNRSAEWYKSTGENLAKIIERLIPLDHHSHHEVRSELANMCEAILTKCHNNMRPSMQHCLQILIALSEDDESRVSEKSRQILDNISDKYLNIYNKSLIDIVENNFYDVISMIPRVINGTDTAKQLAALNLLVGYLRLLGPKNLSRMLHTTYLLKRLMECLIHISELEITDILIFEEHAIIDFESIEGTPMKWKRFKYINEDSLLLKFKEICRLLSNSNAVNIIVDYLSDLFSNYYGNVNETVFILNEILSAKVPDVDDRTSLIKSVLNVYLEEKNWYLPLEVGDSNDADAVNLSEVRYNIVQVCLLVEGVGSMAMAIGEHFKEFLIKALYIVLERAGSSQPFISAAGLLAVSNIAKACGYKGVTHLIIENADYFSFHVVRRLKKLDENANVLDVLNIVLKYSTIEVLPFIMDILEGLLNQSHDKYQQKNITAFLKVFYSFEVSLRRWYDIKVPRRDRLAKLLVGYKKSMDFLYNWYGFSADYDATEDNNKSAEEMYKEDQNDDQSSDYLIEDEEKKPVVPPHVKLTSEILKRSLHFMPSQNQTQKLLVLDILCEGIEVLRDWQDELLPIVHLIWSPLANRFKEYKNPLVINKSFALLVVLGRLSEDFIRLRTSQNVFPDICHVLKTLSSESYLKDRGSAYRYTQAYKLQVSLLRNLPNFIADLDMSMHDVKKALEAAKPYLSNRQPLPLQELCVDFYKTLAYFDFDSVWLYSIDIWGPPCMETNTEFRKNVQGVLDVLDRAKW